MHGQKKWPKHRVGTGKIGLMAFYTLGNAGSVFVPKNLKNNPCLVWEIHLFQILHERKRFLFVLPKGKPATKGNLMDK